ncbi:Fe-S-containing protein [Treponema sp. TIM-1]|uniref:Fe-S-containing protein n=1 Tax=Treponema sp. TIM-1 TaxID=2898417 RepID=UPI00397F7EF8
MLRYLIQVIDHLLTTGILTALLWAVLVQETGGSGERRKMPALWGCAAGTGGALIIAVLRRTTALISQGFFNLWVLSFAIIFGILHILFLWEVVQKPLRNLPFLQKRLSLAEAIPGYINALFPGALLFYALPTIFLYPTEFALADESIFSTDFLFKFIGFIAGLLAVILTVLALYKTGKGLSPKRLKVLLTAAILVNMCHQLVVIVQFLLARRIIPMIRWVFRLIVAAVNNDSVFFYGLMGISFLLPLTLFITGLRTPISGKNPAERRKIRAGLRTNRRWCLTVAVGFVVSIFSVTVVKAYTERGVELSPAEPMTIAGEEILIPIPQVEDGHLHRFAYYASDGTEVRFIVIKKNEIAYGVGLDACDICGATGYYERKGQVICRLCDVVMNISTIGFKGGCNPVPLAYSLRSGNMVVEIANLENEKVRFK